MLRLKTLPLDVPIKTLPFLPFRRIVVALRVESLNSRPFCIRRYQSNEMKIINISNPSSNASNPQPVTFKVTHMPLRQERPHQFIIFDEIGAEH